MLLPAVPPARRRLQISLLESRDQRMGAALSGPSSAGLSSPRSPRSRPRLPAPAAEIHLQVLGWSVQTDRAGVLSGQHGGHCLDAAL